MEIFEVTDKRFDEVVIKPYHVFGKASFNKLNINKVERVYYLLFGDTKIRLGLIGGSKGNVFSSPFSAPFGGFTYISGDVRLQYIEEAVKLFIHWSKGKGFSIINFILPPMYYNTSFVSKQLNCLWREGFILSDVELNFSINLGRIDNDFTERLWRNARKNLRIAMNSRLKFHKCNSNFENEIAYEIISRNRSYHGYPLRMTFQNIIDTSLILKSESFLINDSNDNSLASAIVFHITEEIVQVVYWGDLPGYSELKLINYLSYKLFEFYKNSGKKHIDIGHSTVNSIPNYGLCEFKESLGCDINPRYALSLSLL